MALPPRIAVLGSRKGSQAACASSPTAPPPAARSSWRARPRQPARGADRRPDRGGRSRRGPLVKARPSPPPPRARPARGFLMVEALAVLAISAAILLGLGSLTRLMLRQGCAGRAHRPAGAGRAGPVRPLARHRPAGPRPLGRAGAGALRLRGRALAPALRPRPAGPGRQLPARDRGGAAAQRGRRRVRAADPCRGPAGARLVRPRWVAFGPERVLYEGRPASASPTWRRGPTRPRN